MADNDEPNLGASLKRLRAERGLSLSALATITGLPQSTLSKVENGQMSLNYEKLVHVADVLEIDIRQLFTTADAAGDDTNMARRVIDRRSDCSGKEQHYRFRYLSTELRHRLMLPMVFQIDTPTVPDEDIELMNLIGQRFAYVIDGPVDFLCDQYETVTLETGDAIYIDSAMPHGFAARDGHTAVVLSVLASSNPAYLAIAREATRQGSADASDLFRRQRNERTFVRTKDTVVTED